MNDQAAPVAGGTAELTESEQLDGRGSQRDKAQQPDARSGGVGRLELELRANAGSQAAQPPIPDVDTAARIEFNSVLTQLCAANFDLHHSVARWGSYWRTRAESNLVADFVYLREILSAPENGAYWDAARDGILALRAGNLRVAKLVHRELRFATSRSASLARVIVGLGVYLCFALLIDAAYLQIRPPDLLINPQIFFSELKKFVVNPNQADAVFATAMFGGLGSVISLLLRIGSFEAVRGRSVLYLFLFGLVQPFIGLVIGGVVGAAFAAGLINVSYQHASPEAAINIYFVAVVGFLCGFSERVAKTALATAGRAAGFDDGADSASGAVTGGASARLKVPSAL